MKTEYFIGLDLGQRQDFTAIGDGGAARGSESRYEEAGDRQAPSAATYAAAAVGNVVSGHGGGGVWVDCATGESGPSARWWWMRQAWALPW